MSTATATVTPINPAATPKVTIGRNELYCALRAAALYMSNDETHEHLCGVRLEAGAGTALQNALDKSIYLVATDGHTLVRIRVPGSSTAPCAVTISGAAVKRLIAATKPARNEVSLVELTVGETAVAVDGDGFSCVAPIVDATFPSHYRALLDAHDNVETAAPKIGIDPEYLIRVGRAVKHLGRKKGDSRGLVFRGGESDLDPVRCEYAGGDGFELTALIMPMRI